MDSTFFSEQSSIFLVLVLVFFLVLKFIPRVLLGIPFLDPDLVKEKMDADDDFLILDVRTEREFTSKTGHVPGALNLPLSDIKKRLEESGDELAPLKSLPVCIMCRTENRSPKAARILKNNGFTNLSVMKGGIMAWRRMKLPVEGEAS